MVKEYAERLYAPAEQAHDEFARDDCRAAIELSQWKARMRRDWAQVQVSDVRIENENRHNIPVGDALRVSARVHLGEVDPKHVRVEAYHGEADNDQVRNPAVTPLQQSDQNGNGSYLYQGAVPATESGMYGFSVRVVPTHPHLVQPHELRLITWS
jgi:starch phosphorylase